MAGNYLNPLVDFRFLVEIDSLIVAGFSEVSGLQQTIDVEEYEEGGESMIHYLPKTIKHTNLILKKGLVLDSDLRNWYEQAMKAVVYKSGPIPLKNIKLSIWNERQEEAVVYTFDDAYPVKWIGPTLNAKGNSIAVESLEIVHRGLKKE